MSVGFESLGHQDTPSGPIRLWRRFDVALGVDVYEVKLGDEYLMTSLFPDTEIALSRLGLAALDGDGPFEVVVGGLGLGFTAQAAIEDERVGELVVVEYIQAVIDWHEQALVPGAAELLADGRARLVHGDFFALAASEDGFDSQRPGRTFDAILVDIDHTPEHHLDDTHGEFYTAAGLRLLSRHLRPGGVFALWSDREPIDSFTAILGEALEGAEARIVTFDNVVTGTASLATIYLARRAGD